MKTINGTKIEEKNLPIMNETRKQLQSQTTSYGGHLPNAVVMDGDKGGP